MSDATSADIVVIGSGVAGALAALKMAKAGAAVLILESGPELKRDEIVARFRDAAYKGNFMEPYPATPWSPQPSFIPEDNNYLIQKGPSPYKAQYVRGTGGTTWHWAGQAFRLLPNDFKIQSLYGVGRDWPLSYEDLERFYLEAEVQMGVSGDSDLDSPRTQPYPLPGIPLPHGIARMNARLEGSPYVVTIGPQARNSIPYDGRPACCGNNNCMPICPIDAQYNGGIAVRKAREAGVKVQSNAVVYKIEHDAQDRIVAVHYLDQNKQSHRVTGKTFVVAANGLESPKLLLISTSDKHPDGIANSSGMVGRNLMDHPGSSVEFFADEPIWLGRGPMRPASINNIRDGAFRKERSGLRIDIAATSPVRALTERLIAAGYYGDELNQKIQDQSAHYVLLKGMFEMLPDVNNRIVASKTEKDAWGIPRIEVHYQFPDYVHQGYEHSIKVYQEIVARMGGKNAVYSKRGEYDNNQHITGTMIMGSNPKDSVVDGDCRTHDHENLFLVGTGVMPSSAIVNSTLTGTALALKAAEAVLKTI